MSRARRGASRAVRLASRLAVLGLAAGCASAGTPSPATDDAPACARVFSTNDTHGRLLPAEYPWSEGRLVGGSAVMAGYVREAREAEPDCPLFVASGGDMMQGTLISNLKDGASTIRLFNAIGYDVAAIGNHEFDWGIAVLEQRMAQADFPMLGANIYLEGTDEHPEWARPWAIVEKDGVKVGFVGATTRSTPVTTRPANVTGLEFRSIAEALDRYIPEVRAAGADFVVAVMHEGGFCDEGVCRGEAIEALEAATARFDYAVTGHTHSRIATRIHGAPVVQSYANSTAYGLGRLERAPGGEVRAELLGIRQTFADEVEPDGEIAAMAEAYRRDIADLVERVVAELAEPLSKPRRGDFPLGRLIADAQRAATGAQVAVMNNGGIRVPLEAGPVTYADLFEVQPFGNTLVRLRLSGANLLASLEHALEDAGTGAQVSGLTVRYDPDAPRGEAILDARLDDGTPIARDEVYDVTVNDFMATGGAGYTMFLEAESAVFTGIVDLEALVAYLEDLPQPVRAPSDPRWIPVASP